MAALPQEQEIFSEEAVSSAIQRAATLMGYEKLKNEQFNAVSAVLAGKDTFAALPTGFGKSVIYGILPLAFDELKGNT